ncbi:MAG: glycosyltransferase [Blastocatellia bacterium]|nr:glycosyltransferase [Blastocatellia bacterium]
MKRRVMFYSQHVLGMGHLIRSLEIIRGLSEFDVCFLNGGEIVAGFAPPPSVQVINLPPILADAAFREIHAADESQSLDEIKARRRERILAEYERFQPEALIIELFPFGRRKFAFELIPLLERARRDGHRTLIACSLRDILVSKRDQARFEAQVVDQANRFFDLLLIHSDPAFQRLEETFPSAEALTCAIRYTGFVAPSKPAAAPMLDDEFAVGKEPLIVVSLGGGRVGAELAECAIDASALLEKRLPHRMQIFAGPYMPEEEFARLTTRALGHACIRLQTYTTQFPAWLDHASLSISMAGYNTCMNLAAAGIPAIVYPFTGNNNEEQTIRAEKLERLGIVDIIRPETLSAELLARKIMDGLCIKSRNDHHLLDMGGVELTARILRETISRHAMEVAR